MVFKRKVIAWQKLIENIEILVFGGEMQRDHENRQGIYILYVEVFRESSECCRIAAVNVKCR